MKVIQETLTIILVFQLFGLVEVGYLALFAGYLTTFLIGIAIEILVAGYMQSREEIRSRKND